MSYLHTFTSPAAGTPACLEAGAARLSLSADGGSLLVTTLEGSDPVMHLHAGAPLGAGLQDSTHAGRSSRGRPTEHGARRERAPTWNGPHR